MSSQRWLEPNRRILVIDDNRAIHDDLRKILLGEAKTQENMQDDEELLFGAEPVTMTKFEIDSAYQGQEGFAKLEQSLAEGRPYAMAFVDVRMPPGWDGVETTAHLWRAYPNLQVVLSLCDGICRCPDATRMGWRGNHRSPLACVSEPAGGVVHRLLRLLLERHAASPRTLGKAVDP